MNKTNKKNFYPAIMLTLLLATLISFNQCVLTNTASKSIKTVSEKTSTLGSKIFSGNTNASIIDATAPACTAAVLSGWKCFPTTIRTLEGDEYKILIKWNRSGLTSKGTVLMAVGGAGIGESREDPPSKQMMDELDSLDHIRTVQLEFVDVPNTSLYAANPWGGYWKHFGSYHSAGSAFLASLELIDESGLFTGDFLNYLGGSNGSMIAAYAMSHFGADKYFDRVVFQMGPFLPDLSHACDRLNPASFFINTPATQKSVADLINIWSGGNPSEDVCNTLNNDRTSVLKGGNAQYPNTHVHIIVGADEVTRGFGPWILASNLEYYQAIDAKSKERIVRPGMAHNNSYQDMRRLLKLNQNESPEAEVLACPSNSTGTFCNQNGNSTDYFCNGCGQNMPPDNFGNWVSVGNNCFHRGTTNSCGQCSNGEFCNSGSAVEWACSCSLSGVGWVSQGNGCSHRKTNRSCK
jgi:hypothetical protein